MANNVSTEVLRILSWNIQAGKGVDGRVDFPRLRSVIEAFADGLPELICLQEVSRGYPEFAQDGEIDQIRLLQRNFPEYRLVYGAALDRWEADQRLCFGNAILSRLPLLECFRHALPMPLDAAARRCMPRQALEVIVPVSERSLRVVTTHFEYYSSTQRQAQARYIAAQQNAWRQTANRLPGEDSGPFRRCVCPAATVLCGDFNVLVDDSAYQLLTVTGSGFIDAWRQLNDARAHPPTCGVHDHEQWEQGPHCRDYFFLSESLDGLCAVDMKIESTTDASDHQPLMLEMASG